MDKEQLEQLLGSEFSNGKIDVSQDGNHFAVSIVCASFAGKSMVQRHQQVYRLLGDAFASNAVHALRLDTRTPEEAEDSK